jgi:hypothetical protein
MSYQPGDCVAIPVSGKEYLAVFIVGESNIGYYLAFFDFQGTRPPEPSYLLLRINKIRFLFPAPQL